jgi:RNase H-like domain found in reverse transcriptase
LFVKVPGKADDSKVKRILDWPVPTNAKQVRGFLGLVRYISVFLPALAEHTAVLTPLTKKDCNLKFPLWTAEHQNAFEAIRKLVVSRECLTTIDHENPGDNKIVVTCDASKVRMGAVLSFGPTWETARPVAFDSMQLKGPQLNYPVHEQELLAILQRWRVDLLGAKFEIYTDHRTIENFDTQKDLSRRQARWTEFLSQYIYDIHYVKGEDNTVADALSRLPVVDEAVPPKPVNISAIFSIPSDPELLKEIRGGYKDDPFKAKILADIKAKMIEPSSGIELRNGLL